MARITLRDLKKSFGDFLAVDQLNLEIHHGEFLALLGPSGCGKTTLLRLLAGLEPVSAGEILFNGERVSSVDFHRPPEQRRVGVVFQSYALWPHMSVVRNIGYPLEVRGIRGEDYRQRVVRAMDTVGLVGMAERRPAELSGGQRQRVALARCLVMEPALILLDEPLANLDVHLRATMETELMAFHASSGATVVYITHDQAEAMAMADRVAVMDRGRLLQVASPETLYTQPQVDTVARFVGRGTVLPAEVVTVSGHHAQVTILGTQVAARCAEQQLPGPAQVMLRPEGLKISSEAGIKTRLRRSVYRGGHYELQLQPCHDPQYLLIMENPRRPTENTLLVQIADAWVIPTYASSCT